MATRAAQATGNAPERTPLVLGAIAAALGGLAIYQWIELVNVRSGGIASCTISETLDCVKVWNTAFAKAIHRYTAVPVAGWGLVYAVAALLAPMLRARTADGSRAPAGVDAVRWAALGGLVSCVVLAGVSTAAGAWCPTCMGTYALVVLYAGLAFATYGWRPQGASLAWVGRWLGGALAVGYVAVLWPGIQTPQQSVYDLASLPPTPSPVRPAAAAPAALVPAARAPENPATAPQLAAAGPAVVETPFGAPAAGDPVLTGFLAQLPDNVRQPFADMIEAYRTAPVTDITACGRRNVLGPAGAPVHILEFTDIMCPHCAQLQATFDQILEAAPNTAFTVDSRFFPLDKECNPMMQHSDGKHTRCLGAQVQICLEGKPEFEPVRRALFTNQARLTAETVFDIAGRHVKDLAGLKACVKAPETAAKLRADIECAGKLGIEGTPLVILNGRKIPAIPPLIYALLRAKGRADAPEFAALPRPSPVANRMP